MSNTAWFRNTCTIAWPSTSLPGEPNGITSDGTYLYWANYDSADDSTGDPPTYAARTIHRTDRSLR